MSRRSTSSYAKVSNGGSSRGFRLRYSRRVSVQALRARFVFWFRALKKWTYAYCRGLRFLKIRSGVHGHGHGDGDQRRIGKMSEMGSSRSMNGLVSEFMPRSHECRMRSFGRSNSFYSEAIADCLEFIKRNSVSDDDEKTPSPTVDGFENNLTTTCEDRLELVS